MKKYLISLYTDKFSFINIDLDKIIIKIISWIFFLLSTQLYRAITALNVIPHIFPGR